MTVEQNHSFVATNSSGEVSAIYVRPRNAKWLLVFAHGAGASMRHKFMQTASDKLANYGVATLRFNFPYMEKGKRGPDPQPILKKTVRSSRNSVQINGSSALVSRREIIGRTYDFNGCRRKSTSEYKRSGVFRIPIACTRTTYSRKSRASK